MELNKVQQQWDGFPEVAMEERPVLSSDLEKLVVKNPLSDAFYLRKKLLARIILFSVLWLLNVWLLRAQWKGNGNDFYLHTAFFLLLTWSIYFHLRLLLFADYPTLLSLPLIPFLDKLEIVLDKYITSFKLICAISAFSLVVLFEQWVARTNPSIYESFSQRDWFKWLLLIFLTVSFDILLLHTVIPRYRKLLATVQKYRVGILSKAQNK
jgi:hypothetical protein